MKERIKERIKAWLERWHERVCGCGIFDSPAPGENPESKYSDPEWYYDREAEGWLQRDDR
jgi:hypothetical protein